jgi:AcrR family transcriptional regulator
MFEKENERAQTFFDRDDPERGRLVKREVEPKARRKTRSEGATTSATKRAATTRGAPKGGAKRGAAKGVSKDASNRGASKHGTRGADATSEASPVDGRTRRRLETRERVRQAAFELFVRDGFERTTTSAIAQRAGVAAGTIFLHAPDKADLLFLVMHDRLEAVVEERARSLPDGPLLDRLMHLFEGLFRMYGEYPGLAADFVRHLPGADGPNARRVSTLTLAFLHRLAMLVVDAQRRSEVARDVDLLTCSRNLFGLYFVALLTWLSGQVTLEGALVPTLRDSLALQIRGLRA